MWHRRAGKDATVLHGTTIEAFKRKGLYWHMLPTLAQGRKVIWEGITKDGQKMLDAWPDELIENKRNDEMALTLKNGSRWQVVGSDNYNSLVGSNPCGVVFSEYSVANPAAWDFIRPILAENGGWAVFPYTPRGRNHGYDLYQMALGNPDWHASMLNVDDTKCLPSDAVDQERAAGMSEEMIQQEFYCSFDAPLTGAYYARQMVRMLEEGRICEVPYDPACRVDTWWDLGVDDSTSIVFTQRVGQSIHVIDYYENSGESLSHYVGQLDKRRDGGWLYGEHVLPHDVKARELQTGKTRQQALADLGVKVSVAPQLDVQHGIERVRQMLPRVYIDKKLTHVIECLRQYQKQWDEINKIFKGKPLHDWTSHCADAFRVGATYNRKPEKRRASPQPDIHVY